MQVLQRPADAPYAQLLAHREAQLYALLAPPAPAAPVDEVFDFKDVAAADARAWVDVVQCSVAVRELAQVVAARRRLQEGCYGECLDCGEPIDPRRLRSLPATPYCTACQARSEAIAVTPPPACAG